MGKEIEYKIRKFVETVAEDMGYKKPKEIDLAEEIEKTNKKIKKIDSILIAVIIVLVVGFVGLVISSAGLVSNALENSQHDEDFYEFKYDSNKRFDDIEKRIENLEKFYKKNIETSKTF